jgi:hypothetical protein
VRLDDLIKDGNTSIDGSIKSKIDQGAFRKNISQLRRFEFWSGAGKNPRLWDHQKSAIGTVVAALSEQIRLLCQNVRTGSRGH